jgi:hypothetical protein
MSAPVVFVTLADGRALALDLPAFQRALQQGHELAPARSGISSPQPCEVTDAGGMEQRTGVPASWWLESARRGTVPSLQAGKYRRFVVAEAVEALRSRRR